MLPSFFHMQDLEPLAYVLGLEFHKSDKDLFINQQKYTEALIALA